MEEQQVCPTCGVFLTEPYIRCMECRYPSRCFCLQCFAKGREYENHLSDHRYKVIRNNFELLCSNWTAAEELRLLNAISECGFGNWHSVERLVGTKSKEECEDHYVQYYLYRPQPPLPIVPQAEVLSDVHPTPVAYRTCNDPPRPHAGSGSFYEMAGYMPARGDFSVEYDEYAELDIKELEFTSNDDMLWVELQKAVLKMYQSRLGERFRRKCIIKTYGLINMRKNMEDWRRYDILGKTVQDKLKVFMRLVPPVTFYKLLEGLRYAQKVRQRIQVLQDCHEAGITKLSFVNTYLNLKKKREIRARGRSALDEILNHVKSDMTCQQYIRKQALKESMQGLPEVSAPSGRRPAPPLAIAGMPGYEKLNAKERDLCAKLRLMPESYLGYKNTLINEFRKSGSLRLATARTIIKIDVNKTRKIYDLLLDEGLVHKGV